MVLNVHCQQVEDIVQCNEIYFDQDKSKQMNLEEQDELVNKVSIA